MSTDSLIIQAGNIMLRIFLHGMMFGHQLPRIHTAAIGTRSLLTPFAIVPCSESPAMIATAYAEVSAPSWQYPSAELHIGLGTG